MAQGKRAPDVIREAIQKLMTPPRTYTVPEIAKKARLSDRTVQRIAKESSKA